ncbi:MAG TPA: glycosyltransferase family 9 protein [Mycobacteriales bacterium]|nr:glycosyltransferase family 9 protein [Mycobacteriales bacterium]
MARRFADMLQNHCVADSILVCPDPFDVDLAAWQEFCSELKSRDFGLCVLHPNAMGLNASHARAAGIPIRVGFAMGRPADRDLTHRVGPSSIAERLRWDLFDLVAAIGDVLFPDGDGNAAVDRFRTFPMRPEPVPELDDGRRWIAVHPVGQRVWNRRWPLENYVELCRRLVGDLGRNLYLFGAESDAEELESIRAEVAATGAECTVHVDTNGSVNRVANVIARIDLLIGNDSALHHLAGLIGTPTVVVYGPSRAVVDGRSERVYPHQHPVISASPCRLRWVPLKAAARGRTWVNGHLEVDEFDIQSRQASCDRGCRLHYQDRHGSYPRCLQDIEVDAVWTAVRQAMKGLEPA